MLSLIKKDLRLIFSSSGITAFILLYIPLILLLVGENSYSGYIYLVIIASYSYMVTTMSFSYDVTYKTHLLVQSLPVSKNEIVLSKYLLMFINFVISVIYSGVYIWILNKLNISSIEFFNVSKLKVALPVVIISISVALPAFLRLPPKIASFINLFIYMMTINFFSMKVSTLDKILSNRLLIMFNGFGFTIIALGIMLVSIIISNVLYSTRDLK